MEEGHYRCTLKKSHRSFRLSMRPQLQIKFKFLFKFKNSYLIAYPDLATPLVLVVEGPSSKHKAFAAVTVAGGGSLSYDAVREAVGGAVGDLLTADNRRCLIEAACREVGGGLPAGTLPKYRTLRLGFEIRVERLRFYVPRSDADRRMVPAAASSLGMLDELSEADDRESCCCICMEEFGGGERGGGVLRMPCSHVFHGGCIDKWLRSSHYCPICRYEMPTE